MVLTTLVDLAGPPLKRILLDSTVEINQQVLVVEPNLQDTEKVLLFMGYQFLWLLWLDQTTKFGS